MRMLWRLEKPEMQQRNILFQEEDRDVYVRTMLNCAMHYCRQYFSKDLA